MKKFYIVIAIALILIIVASAFELYTYHGSGQLTYAKGQVISITDDNGDVVNITEPVTRIVCIDSYSTTIICALGAENRLVGRDALSTFPSSVLNITSIGEDYDPSIEEVLSLNPDLVIGDAMVNYTEPAVNELEAAGIPVFLSESLNPVPNPYSNQTIVDTTCALITQLGEILNEQANATKLVNFMQHYNNLVQQRLAALTPSEKPTVYFEWYFDWETEPVPYVAQAGGINIAANSTTFLTTLSPEYITEANPDVIIDMISSPDHNMTDFVTARDEMLSRPALADTPAVKNGDVYVIDGSIFGGLCCLQGYLQWAKWLHPSLFEDINPATVQQQLFQEFLNNATMPGVYSYP